MIATYSYQVSARVNKITEHGKASCIETCEVRAENRDIARRMAVKKFLDMKYAVSVEDIRVPRRGTERMWFIRNGVRTVFERRSGK